MLTRAQIAAVVLASKVVAVPEWGGEVVVVEMSGADRDDWELATYRRWKAEQASALREKREFDGVRVETYGPARLVAWTLRGEDGAPLYLVRKPDGHVDIDATEAAVLELAASSGRAVARLYPVAEELNLTRPGALEAVQGNSAGTPGASPSTKPA